MDERRTQVPRPSDELTAIGPSADSPERTGTVPLGTVVGRYVIIKLIGQGGMGAVYAAYDPDLDRRVALKLLRADRLAQPAADQVRLVGEAKAMARLSHPNVIAIFDVGAFAGLVFLAMELVDGVTLREWMIAQRHHWRDCVRLFIDAGRGLAAAHQAGLVHRDFKPENVMLTSTGLVRVMDFGLARSLDDPTSIAVDLSISAELPAETASKASLIGTPAYMSPEQFAGLPTDARSDQFSYCVALHEALYGVRPFTGASIQTLAASVQRGIVRSDVRSSVPWAVRRVVLRGLETSPSRRYPALSDLIDDLDHLLSRRRRRWLAMGFVALATLVAALSATLASQRTPVTCGDGASRWTGVWEMGGPGSGPPGRSRIQVAFARTGVATAKPTFERVASVLDSYVTHWSIGYRDACEATRVRGEQSQELFDLRMECLQSRVQSVRSLTDLLANADPSTVSHAIEAVDALEPVDACADGPALRAHIRPIPTGVSALNVARAKTLLADGKASFDLGKWDDAIKLGDEARSLPTVISYCPVIAESLLLIGTAQAEWGQPGVADGNLETSFWTAESCRHDDVAARASIYLLQMHALALRRLDMSDIWQKAARAAVERIEHPGILRLWLLNAMGATHQAVGRLQEALSDYRQVLASAEEAHSELNIAIGASQVGLILDYLGRFDEAAPYHDRAISVGTRIYGMDHARVLAFRENQVENLNARGRWAEAQPLIREILRGFNELFGPNHVYCAHALTSMGVALMGQGEYVSAVPFLERALDLRQRDERQPVLIATTRFGLARALWEVGKDRKRALKLARQALATYREFPEFVEGAGVQQWLLAHGDRP